MTVPLVLTSGHLNRALLARQLLLDRPRLPLPRALEQVGGLQAQYAPSMYVGLWSRLDGFTRDQLTRALERRTVVQGTLLRSTIHLVSRRDYWHFASAIRAARREWWVRVQRDDVDPDRLAAVAAEMRRRLAGGALRQPELEEIFGAKLLAGASLWLDLVRVPSSGTWGRRRADLYAAAEDWIGPSDVTPEAATVQLVRRYLQAFGPAPRKDVATWAGLPVRAVGAALECLDLRRFRDENGKELVDLPGAPLPDPGTPAPVRFLPTWDATLLVHVRRTGILPEQYRPRIFNTKMPQSVGTVLVDGMVAGTWRYEHRSVSVQPFHDLRRVAREVAEEADRLAAFVA